MDSKFKVFVITAFVILFAGMMAGGFFIVKTVTDKEPVGQVGEIMHHPKDIVVFPIASDITTNLISDEDAQRKHVIKVTVGFGIDKKGKDFKDLSKDFVEKEMIIRNEIIQSIRDQSYESLSAKDGQEKLAEIIVSRLSTVLATQSIVDMYFGEFFVQ